MKSFTQSLAGVIKFPKVEETPNFVLQNYKYSHPLVYKGTSLITSCVELLLSQSGSYWGNKGENRRTVLNCHYLNRVFSRKQESCQSNENFESICTLLSFYQLFILGFCSIQSNITPTLPQGTGKPKNWKICGFLCALLKYLPCLLLRVILLCLLISH